MPLKSRRRRRRRTRKRKYRHKRYIKRRTRRYRRRKTRRKRGGAGSPVSGIKTVDDLYDKLLKGGVPEEEITKWGTGRTKSLNQLLEEVKNKDTILVNVSDKIMREVNILHVSIYNADIGKQFELWEWKHLDLNSEGQLKLKDKDVEGMHEKFDPNNQTKLQVLKRAVAEELGSEYTRYIRYEKGQPKFDIEKPQKPERKSSHSYPGLPAEYITYRETIYIPKLGEDHPPLSSITSELATKWGIDPGTTGAFETIEYKDKEKRKVKRYILWQWRNPRLILTFNSQICQC